MFNQYADTAMGAILVNILGVSVDQLLYGGGWFCQSMAVQSCAFAQLIADAASAVFLTAWKSAVWLE
jgi:hypothetical protein